MTRFVYVSFEELGTGAPLEHSKRVVEEGLRASEIRYTILRAGFAEVGEPGVLGLGVTLTGARP